MDSIYICSLNINGIRNKKQRNSLFRTLKKKNFDIICLQETFITDEVSNIWEREWGGQMFYSPGTNNSKGQIILINKDFPFAISTETITDRILTISFTTDKGKINIVNSYAPNTDRVAFFTCLSNHLDSLEGELIVCGDFNCVLDNDLDIISGNKHNNRDVEFFQEVITTHSLNDTWRLFHSDEKEFSWSRKNPFLARRLDYLFTSDNIFDTCILCDMVSYSFTDHRSVEIKYSLSNMKRGPSYWKFNDSLLKDKVYLDQMNIFLDNYFQTTVGLEDQLRWDLCKVKIKEFTIDFSKKKRKSEKNEQKKLNEELNKIDIELGKEDNTNKQFYLAERDRVKRKLEIFDLEKAKSAQIRSRVKFIEEGEKNTKYFLGLEKARANAKIMDRLETDDGRIITDQQEILKEQVRFYSDVYRQKNNFNEVTANEFTRNLNIPKITNEQKDSLETEINIDEISKALKHMKNDSSPGSDGITYSFLKIFWSKIKYLIMNSYNASFTKGELSYTQRQGILTLLHKGKNLSRSKLSNWRPISLTNTDYKILSKTIANRLNTVISDIVDNDQVGFIKGRNSSTIIREIDDTIDYINSSKQSGILLAVDYKRAFDSISKEYLLWAFKQFGFGDYFLKWVEVIISNSESKVNYMGWISESFKVETGVRQGCPLSPSAFILGLELLAIKIRSENNLQGLVLPTPIRNASISKVIKIALYADDITLFLKNIEDFNLAIEIFTSFTLFTGLEMNRTKIDAMWLGPQVPNIQSISNIAFKSKLKILGIIFSNRLLASNNEENWIGRINKIKELISKWTKRNLSISGKLCIIKTYLVSQLVYIMQSLAIPDKVLNTINTILFRFLWKKKDTNQKAFEKVKRNTLCNDYDKGGIKMINIIDMQNSFLISWLNKLYFSNHQKWTYYPNYIFSTLGPDLNCIKTTASIKTFVGLSNIKSEFWKKALMSWIKHNNKIDVCQQEHFISQSSICLWNNKYLMYRGKCLFFKDWALAGLNYIHDIKHNGNLLTFNEICRLVGNKPCRIFEYNAIYTATMSANARNIPQAINDNIIFEKVVTPKQIRLNISFSNEQPSINSFWDRKFNIQLTSNNWLVGRECTKEERLRLLHWKILHNLYPTNILLNKMGIRDTNLCQDCLTIDYIEHFFFACRRIRRVWDLCQNYIFISINKSIKLTQNDILLGHSIDKIRKNEVRFINQVILITKMVISKFRYGTSFDLEFLFNAEINLREKYLSRLL